MRALLLIPFSYAYLSRYKEDVWFYLSVEYVPAFLITLLFGSLGFTQNLLSFVVSFLAFISVYEIGYLVNDYIAVRWEESPRMRGVIDASPALLTAWSASRIAVLWWAGSIIAPRVGFAFWSFYIFLSIVFAAHNLLRKKEPKVCTFYWLSLCRFVGTTIWHLDSHNLVSMLLSGTVLYSGFRLLGYMESKGLLVLKNRKSSTFKLLYYSLPLPLATLVASSDPLSPFPLLSAYYFAGAGLSAALTTFRKSAKEVKA